LGLVWKELAGALGPTSADSIAMSTKNLTTFSKVDTGAILAQVDEDERKGAADQSPSMGGMGGMGDMGGLDDADGMGGGGFIPEDPDDGSNFAAHHLESSDVGKTFDVLKDHSVTKTLLTAGSDYDNPQHEWDVEVDYKARVAGSETPFEEATRRRLTVGSTGLPAGVEAGLKTMQVGEVSRFTVQPSQGYGDAGDAARGVPAASVLEYEMTLHRLFERTQSHNGQLVKWRLVKGTSWERPSSRAEITLRWTGRLIATDCD
jgi:hypothetical protein